MRALKVLSEREVTPQLGLLKSTLLQLDSTFSEREYGVSSFRDFMEKVAQAGRRHAEARRTQHARRAARGRGGRRGSRSADRRRRTAPVETAVVRPAPVAVRAA